MVGGGGGPLEGGGGEDHGGEVEVQPNIQHCQRCECRGETTGLVNSMSIKYPNLLEIQRVFFVKYCQRLRLFSIQQGRPFPFVSQLILNNCRPAVWPTNRIVSDNSSLLIGRYLEERLWIGQQQRG